MHLPTIRVVTVLAVILLLGCQSELRTTSSANRSQMAEHNGSVKLMSVNVQTDSVSLPEGGMATLAAVGIYEDGTTQDVTDAAAWSIDSSALALDVSDVVTVTGVKPGKGSVTATIDDMVGSLELTVTSATLASLAVTANSTTKMQATTEQLTATGTYSDGTTQNLTQAVDWHSSDTSRVSVDSSGSKGLVTAIAPGTAKISATKGEVSAELAIKVSDATLTGVQITPPTQSIAKGLSSPFTATGIYSNSATQDLTSLVAWSSSDGSVATVAAGTVTGVGIGSATILASQSGHTATAAVTVTAATITALQLTASPGPLPKGATRQYTATAIFSDNTNQDVTTATTWSSSDSAVASVSNAPGTNGRVTANLPGDIVLSASYGGSTASANLTVSAAALTSIAVSPSAPSNVIASTQQFTATGTYTDGSTQDVTNSVTWSSSNTAKVTISNAVGSKGLATSIASGSTNIIATSGSIVGSTTLTVSASPLQTIDVTVTHASVPLGVSQQYTATGTYANSSTQDLTSLVTWSSSDQAVLSVSNSAGSRGLGSSLAVGTATVTATSGSISGSYNATITAAELVSITVTPSNPSVAAGLTRQFTAIGTYTDNSTLDITTQVTWQSASTSVATISNVNGSRGLASTLVVGTSVISAASGSITGQTTLTVGAATLASIAVTPSAPTVAKGLIQQLTATGTYTDSSTQDVTTAVSWTSSDTGVATVSNTAGTKGRVTTLTTGASTVTATSGSINGSTVVTVSAPTLASVSVTPKNSSAAYGGTRQFTLTGTYTDASTQDLTTSATWTSSDTGIATINGTGLASSVALGDTTIEATIGALSNSTLLTIAAQANPTNPSSPGATVDSDTQISLSWVSGGGTTTSYVVAYVSGSTAPASCTTGTQVTSGVATKVITGLTPGTEYSFRICAANGNPTPNLSSGITVSATTLQEAPTAPTGLSATVNSTTQITLNWTSGGGSTTGFRIAYQLGASAPANCSTGTTTTSATASKIITGLAADSEYSFLVCAVNGNATPDVSTGISTTATTLEAPPPNPTGLSATVDSATQITLTWSSAGGSTASYGIAYQSGSSAPANCGAGTTSTSGTTSKVVSGLTADTEYSFRVCALNSNSTPDVSAGVTTSATTDEAPAGPAQLTLTGTADDAIITLSAAASTAILEDDGTPANGTIQIRSTNGSFATTTFPTPANSLTIYRGHASDTLVIAVPSSEFNAALTIGTSGERLTSVTFSEAQNISGGSGGVTVYAATTTIDEAIVATGSAGVSLDVTTALVLNGDATGATPIINSGGPVAQTGAGTASFKGKIVTTNANVSFASAVTLTDDAFIDTGAGAGNITLSGTLNGTTSASDDLSLSAGTGNVTFSGLVGSSTSLGAITIASAANVTTSAALTAASFSQESGTGTTTIGAALSTSASQGFDVTTNIFTLSGALTTTGGGSVFVKNSGNATISSGTGSINSAGSFVQNGIGAMTIAGGITTNNAPISFSGAITIGASPLVINAGTGDISFAALLQIGNRTLTLRDGNGGVTLGTSTTIANGTLNVFEAATATVSSLNMASGSLFTGTGTVNAVLNVGTGATLAPASSATLQGTGTLTFSDDVNLASGSVLAIELNGTTAGTGYDRLAFPATGKLNIGTGAVLSRAGSLTPTVGNTFKFVDGLTAISTSSPFVGAADGSTLYLTGSHFTIAYNASSGDIDLTCVAPPGGLATVIDNDETSGSYLDTNNSATITFDPLASWTINSVVGRGLTDDLRFAAPTAAQNPTATATYAFTGLTPGDSYRVSATWFPTTNRATNAKFTVSTTGTGGSSNSTVEFNQKLAPSTFSAVGKNWDDVSTSFTVGSDGTLSVMIGNNVNGYIVADAIRIESVVSAAPTLAVYNGSTRILNSNTLAYGAIVQGAADVDKIVTIKNIGSTPLLLGTATLTAPAGFEIVGGYAPGWIAPGASIDVTIRLLSTNIGSFSGAIAFSTNVGSFTFNVTGQVTSGSTWIAKNAEGADGAIATTSAVFFGSAPVTATYGETGAWRQSIDGLSFRFVDVGTTATATWTFIDLTPGTYRVSVNYVVGSNRATNVNYSVTDGTTTVPATIAQNVGANDLQSAGSAWEDLASAFTVAGTTLSVTLDATGIDNFALADGVRIERTGP